LPSDTGQAGGGGKPWRKVCLLMLRPAGGVAATPVRFESQVIRARRGEEDCDQGRGGVQRRGAGLRVFFSQGRFPRKWRFGFFRVPSADDRRAFPAAEGCPQWRAPDQRYSVRLLFILLFGSDAGDAQAGRSLRPRAAKRGGARHTYHGRQPGGGDQQRERRPNRRRRIQFAPLPTCTVTCRHSTHPIEAAPRAGNKERRIPWGSGAQVEHQCTAALLRDAGAGRKNRSAAGRCAAETRRQAPVPKTPKPGARTSATALFRGPGRIKARAAPGPTPATMERQHDGRGDLRGQADHHRGRRRNGVGGPVSHTTMLRTDEQLPSAAVRLCAGPAGTVPAPRHTGFSPTEQRPGGERVGPWAARGASFHTSATAAEGGHAEADQQSLERPEHRLAPASGAQIT